MTESSLLRYRKALQSDEKKNKLINMQLLLLALIENYENVQPCIALDTLDHTIFIINRFALAHKPTTAHGLAIAMI